MTMISPMIAIGCCSVDAMSDVVGRDADPYSPPKTSPRMVVNASTNQSTSRNRKGRLRSVAAVSFFVVDRNAANAVPLLRGSRGRYGAPPPPAAVAGEGAGPP